MNNLNTSGLNLRTITAVEYGQLVQDLQYNFLQILNAPGFRGRQGESIQGPTGIGVRGSKWIFVTLAQMTAAYQATSVEQITLTFINTNFVSDPTYFTSSIDIPGETSLLIGDILVLPTGQLVSLNEIEISGDTAIRFVDTGITFAQVSSLSETRVIEIFNELYSASAMAGAFRHYNAVAKNFSDASPANNQNANQDSVIDIVVPGAGPGAALPTHTFVTARDQTVLTDTQMCLIAGSPIQYHELIQSTQEIHTNNYAPGMDDFAAFVMLQNSYSNGMIFGHKNAESIRDFGRLYRSTNATVLTSSYSPVATEYSELNLSNTEAIIRAVKATINVTTMDVLAATYNSRFMSYAGNTVKIGDRPNAIVEIYGPNGVYLKNQQNAQVLGTDVNGRIINSYEVLNQIQDGVTNSQFFSALAIYNEFLSINEVLDDHETRLDALESVDTTKYFQKTGWSNTSINMNSIVANGNFLIKTGMTISNFVTGVTTAPADLHVNTFVSLKNPENDEQRLMQEVTMSGSTEFATYMNGIKWFRVGSKIGNGQWSFTNWSKNVTGNDKVIGDSGLESSGSFNTSNMTIKHKPKNVILENVNNTGPTVIQGMQFDAYGHPISVTSKNLSEVFLELTDPIKDAFWGPIGGTNTNPLTVAQHLDRMMEFFRTKHVETNFIDVADNTGPSSTPVSVSTGFNCTLTDYSKYAGGLCIFALSFPVNSGPDLTKFNIWSQIFVSQSSPAVASLYSPELRIEQTSAVKKVWIYLRENVSQSQQIKVRVMFATSQNYGSQFNG